MSRLWAILLFIITSLPAAAQQERPLAEPMFNLWVASRFDVIVDFSRYRDGDKIQVWNDLGMPAS